MDVFKKLKKRVAKQIKAVPKVAGPLAFVASVAGGVAAFVGASILGVSAATFIGGYVIYTAFFGNEGRINRIGSLNDRAPFPDAEKYSVFLVPFNSLNIQCVVRILSFCDYDDVIRCMRISHEWNALLKVFVLDPLFLKMCALKGFDQSHMHTLDIRRKISLSRAFQYNSFRGNVWYSIMQSRSSVRWPQGIYESLIQQGQLSDSFPAIQRDVKRTMPLHPLFKDVPDGVTRLANLLAAYCARDPELGYCQGLNYVAGILLTKLSEEEAFWVLDTLLRDYNVRQLYLGSMPQLQRLQAEFTALVHSFLPDLYYHFERSGVYSTMYTSEWFATLFSYNLEMETVYRIWDLFLVDGWLALHRIGLVVLYFSQDALLEMEFDEMITHLKHPKQCSVLYDSNKLILHTRLFENIDLKQLSVQDHSNESI